MNGPLVGQRFSLMKRLTLSLSLMIVMFTIITVLAFVDTGKSFSEGLILASINPQYDKIAH